MISFKQGKFKPTHPEKYLGDPNNIVYRSGLELKFFYRCDNNSNIIAWASEEFSIPYYSEYDGKNRNYFVDLFIKVRSKDGMINSYIAEIKPKAFTTPPKLPKSGRRTKWYLQECRDWIVNNNKWDAAKKFAEEKNMKFIILTEKDLK